MADCGYVLLCSWVLLYDNGMDAVLYMFMVCNPDYSHLLGMTPARFQCHVDDLHHKACCIKGDLDVGLWQLSGPEVKTTRRLQVYTSAF